MMRDGRLIERCMDIWNEWSEWRIKKWLFCMPLQVFRF